MNNQFQAALESMRGLVDTLREVMKGESEGVREFVENMSTEERNAYAAIWDCGEDMLDILQEFYDMEMGDGGIEDDPSEYTEWRDFNPDA